MLKLGMLATTILLSSTAPALADSRATDGLEFETIQNDLILDSRNKMLSDSSVMKNSVRPYDPINKKSYEKAMLGPVMKNRSFFNKKYSHYRFVTVYNVTNSVERIAYLPFLEEECFDDNYAMGTWGEKRMLKVSLTSTVGIKNLGFSASVSATIAAGVTFSTNRRVKSTNGVEARHYPFKVSDTFNGVTYIQTYNKKTGGYGFLAGRGYPVRFSLDNQNIGLRVVREVTGDCLN